MFLTQNIMWNKIICLIEISIDVRLSRYQNHYIYQPNRWYLTKITLQLFDKTIFIKLHWLPWILLPSSNPFLTSTPYQPSCDLPQNLSDYHLLFNYLSHPPIFSLLDSAGWFWLQCLDNWLHYFPVLGAEIWWRYGCSKWEHIFPQTTAEKIVIFFFVLAILSSSTRCPLC